MREKTFEEYHREHRSDFDGKSREELIAMLIREASALTDVVGAGISLQSHTHTNVASGDGTSGPPSA